MTKSHVIMGCKNRTEGLGDFYGNYKELNFIIIWKYTAELSWICDDLLLNSEELYWTEFNNTEQRWIELNNAQ